jgi:hypothetical protein
MNKAVPSSKAPGRNIFWIITALILVAGNIILLTTLIKTKSDLNRYSDAAEEISNYDMDLVDCRVRLDDALAREADDKQKISSLENKVDILENKVQGFSSLSTQSISEFRKKGLNSPERDIIADLMNHPEMIPIKPTQGGQMGFYDHQKILILNQFLVYAYFTDGRKSGTMILEYSVSDGGKIKWNPMKAFEY